MISRVGVELSERFSTQHDAEELRRCTRRRQYAAGRRDARGERITLEEIRGIRYLLHADDGARRAYWLGVLREAA